MVTPGTPDLSLPMHEAIFWRGLFLHRYSGIEHSVTELLVRALAREEYAPLGKLPFPWPKRLRLLTKVLNTEGSISPFAERIRSNLVPATALEEHRHMMAHGMMAINVRDADPRSLYFEGYGWQGGDLGQTTLEISIDDLIAMTQGLGPLAMNLTRSIAELFNAGGLNAVTLAERQDIAAEPRLI